MNSNKFSYIALAAAVLLMAFSAFAQDETFSDPNVDYKFILPDARWKMTVKPSATSPNVEYVYGDRRDGHLEVRRLTIAKDAILTDVIQDDEQKRQFLPGYVAGKEENFVGKLRGAIFNFEFVRSGANMGGRYYFLRANETTVYVLRFTGQKDELRGIRNQTDS
ncbi:MAG: hypothetical protein ABJB40_12550, partial [Acidobacteriota bacterium]